MNEEDSIVTHLKSDERKERKAEILRRASELVDKNKERPRPKRTNAEIQRMIEDYRQEIEMENMNPPPPEILPGDTAFVNQSEINFGPLMPRRFKGARAGEEPKEVLTLPKDSKEFIQREMINDIRKFDSAPPQTMKQLYDDNKVFSHTTDLTFRDLTTEEYREYMYDNGGVLRVKHPWKLAISKSGNHRVATLDGFSYIIAPNWIAIRVKKKVGAPAFTF